MSVLSRSQDSTRTVATRAVRGLGAARLGRGLAFPILADRRGLVPTAEGTDKVRQAMLLILETEPGERVMRPGFGAGLRTFLFEPNTPSTRALIQREVAAALGQWEPRIEVDAVTAERGGDPAEVLISISYTIRRTGRSDLLIYPFWLRS